MKRKTLMTIVAAAAAGYFIIKDKLHNDMIKRLVNTDVFKEYKPNESEDFNEEDK